MLDLRARRCLLGGVLPATAEDERPTLPDYELLRLIGRGSYGDVWLARGVTGAYRAVKIVWRSRFPDLQPYEREFKGLTEFAAISLEESRQLALLHVGRTPEFFYYVMELADDRERGREIDPVRYSPHTLKDLIAIDRGVPAPDVLRLAVDLAQALAGLHARGLVHRDIKPSNVIFVSGVPKLADIGLVASASAALTFVGTEGYVPPEGPGAPAADVFSLGKVLYELSTGLTRNDYPRLPADLHARPDRKELLELNEVILRACAAHPENRYSDAAALLDDLRLLQAGKSVRRLRAAERRLGRALRLAAVLAVIAAVAGAGAWVERRRANDQLNRRQAAEAERDELAKRSVYAANLAQAQRAIEKHDYGRARRLIAAAGPAELRGFEWHALRQAAAGSPSEILRATGAAIVRITISPDETLIAVHDESRAVTVLEAATGREVRHLTGVQRLAGFSADGEWLVGTAQPASKPARWNLATGAAAIAAQSAPALRALGVQGAHLIGVVEARAANATSKARPLAVVVWDFARGEVAQQIPLDESGSEAPWEFFRSAVAAAGDALALASVKGRGSLSQFRLSHVSLSDGGKVRHQMLDGFLPSQLSDPATSPIGEWSATESATGRQLVYDAASTRWLTAKERTVVGTNTAEIAISGPASASSRVRVQTRAADLVLEWPNSPDHRSLWLRGHEGLVTAAAIANDGRWVYSGSQGGELRRWTQLEASAGPASRQCWNSQSGPTGAVFSPGGDLIYVPENGSDLVILRVTDLHAVGSIPGMRRPLVAARDSVWGIDGNARRILRWDRRTQESDVIFEDSDRHIVRACAASNTAWACVVRDDGSMVRLKMTETLPHPQPVAGHFRELRINTLADDGGHCWAVGRANDLSCYELPSGRMVWQTKLPARVPDTRLIARDELAVALENGEIHVYSAFQGGLLRRLPAGSSAAQALALSPDNARLFAAGSDGALHVLAPGWASHLASFSSDRDEPLHYVTISPDGRTAATLSKNGLLHLFRTSSAR